MPPDIRTNSLLFNISSARASHKSLEEKKWKCFFNKKQPPRAIFRDLQREMERDVAFRDVSTGFIDTMLLHIGYKYEMHFFYSSHGSCFVAKLTSLYNNLYYEIQYDTCSLISFASVSDCRKNISRTEYYDLFRTFSDELFLWVWLIFLPFVFSFAAVTPFNHDSRLFFFHSFFIMAWISVNWTASFVPDTRYLDPPIEPAALSRMNNARRIVRHRSTERYNNKIWIHTRGEKLPLLWWFIHKV